MYKIDEQGTEIAAINLRIAFIKFLKFSCIVNYKINYFVINYKKSAKNILLIVLNHVLYIIKHPNSIYNYKVMLRAKVIREINNFFNFYILFKSVLFFFQENCSNIQEQSSYQRLNKFS